MPQKEEILWEILELMHEKTAGWSFGEGDNQQTHRFTNAHNVAQLKSKLVLKFLPSDIEDTIYFMKHRSYFQTHGQGLMMPELVYEMTEKAIDVLNNRALPDNEENAFKDSLWNIEPKIYGVGPNVPAWKKWIKKSLGGKK